MGFENGFFLDGRGLDALLLWFLVAVCGAVCVCYYSLGACRINALTKKQKGFGAKVFWVGSANEFVHIEHTSKLFSDDYATNLPSDKLRSAPPDDKISFKSEPSCGNDSCFQQVGVKDGCQFGGLCFLTFTNSTT